MDVTPEPVAGPTGPPTPDSEANSMATASSLPPRPNLRVSIPRDNDVSGDLDTQATGGDGDPSMLQDLRQALLDEPPPADCKPLDRPAAALAASISTLIRQHGLDKTAKDWQAEQEAVENIQRLVHHHEKVVQPSLQQVVQAMLPCVSAQRSATAKATLASFQILVRRFGDQLHPHMQRIVVALLRQAGTVGKGNSDNFLARCADAVLTELALTCKADSVASALLKAFNKEQFMEAERMKLAAHLDEVLTLTRGSPQVLAHHFDTAYEAAARFAEDGKVETRMHAKRILWAIHERCSASRFDQLTKGTGSRSRWERVVAALNEASAPGMPPRLGMSYADVNGHNARLLYVKAMGLASDWDKRSQIGTPSGRRTPVSAPRGFSPGPKSRGLSPSPSPGVLGRKGSTSPLYSQHSLPPLGGDSTVRRAKASLHTSSRTPLHTSGRGLQTPKPRRGSSGVPSSPVGRSSASAVNGGFSARSSDCGSSVVGDTFTGEDGTALRSLASPARSIASAPAPRGAMSLGAGPAPGSVFSRGAKPFQRPRKELTEAIAELARARHASRIQLDWQKCTGAVERMRLLLSQDPAVVKLELRAVVTNIVPLLQEIRSASVRVTACFLQELFGALGADLGQRDLENLIPALIHRAAEMGKTGHDTPAAQFADVALSELVFNCVAVHVVNPLAKMCSHTSKYIRLKAIAHLDETNTKVAADSATRLDLFPPIFNAAAAVARDGAPDTRAYAKHILWTIKSSVQPRQLRRIQGTSGMPLPERVREALEASVEPATPTRLSRNFARHLGPSAGVRYTSLMSGWTTTALADNPAALAAVTQAMALPVQRSASGASSAMGGAPMSPTPSSSSTSTYRGAVRADGGARGQGPPVPTLRGIPGVVDGVGGHGGAASVADRALSSLLESHDSESPGPSMGLDVGPEGSSYAGTRTTVPPELALCLQSAPARPVGLAMESPCRIPMPPGQMSPSHRTGATPGGWGGSQGGSMHSPGRIDPGTPQHPLQPAEHEHTDVELASSSGANDRLGAGLVHASSAHQPLAEGKGDTKGVSRQLPGSARGESTSLNAYSGSVTSAMPLTCNCGAQVGKVGVTFLDVQASCPLCEAELKSDSVGLLEAEVGELEVERALRNLMAERDIPEFLQPTPRDPPGGGPVRKAGSATHTATAPKASPGAVDEAAADSGVMSTTMTVPVSAAARAALASVGSLADEAAPAGATPPGVASPPLLSVQAVAARLEQAAANLKMAAVPASVQSSMGSTAAAGACTPPPVMSPPPVALQSVQQQPSPPRAHAGEHAHPAAHEQPPQVQQQQPPAEVVQQQQPPPVEMLKEPSAEGPQRSADASHTPPLEVQEPEAQQQLEEQEPEGQAHAAEEPSIETPARSSNPREVATDPESSDARPELDSSSLHTPPLGPSADHPPEQPSTAQSAAPPAAPLEATVPALDRVPHAVPALAHTTTTPHKAPRALDTHGPPAPTASAAEHESTDGRSTERSTGLESEGGGHSARSHAPGSTAAEVKRPKRGWSPAALMRRASLGSGQKPTAKDLAAAEPASGAAAAAAVDAQSEPGSAPPEKKKKSLYRSMKKRIAAIGWGKKSKEERGRTR